MTLEQQRAFEIIRDMPHMRGLSLEQHMQTVDELLSPARYLCVVRIANGKSTAITRGQQTRRYP